MVNHGYAICVLTPSFMLLLEAPEETLSVLLEGGSGQGLDECVCRQVLTPEMFQSDDLVVNLFNQEVYASKNFCAPLMLP